MTRLRQFIANHIIAPAPVDLDEWEASHPVTRTGIADIIREVILPATIAEAIAISLCLLLILVAAALGSGA